MSTTRLTRGRSWQRELLSILQAVLLGLVVTAYAGVCSSLSGRAFTTDFVQFFASAQSLRAGDSIYKPLQFEDFEPAPADAGIRPAQVHPNLNPPLLALLVAPLTLLGLQWAYAVWVALSLVSGLCACALLWRGVRQADRKDSELVWLWLAFLVYFPTYTAVTLGQVTTFLFLALAGAWLAARRGRGRLAGVLVGVAVSLKPFVALLVVFFALQRRWRVVAWAIGTALLTALVTLPFVGTAAYREYFTVIRSVTWFGNSWNASYSSFITRILGGSENVPLVNAPVFAHGLEHGQNIFHRCASLDIVDRRENEPSTRAENLDTFAYFTADLIRSPKGKCALGVYPATPEGQTVAELRLQLRRVHPRRRALDRVQNVETCGGEIVEQQANGTTRVDQRLPGRVLVNPIIDAPLEGLIEIAVGPG